MAPLQVRTAKETCSVVLAVLSSQTVPLLLRTAESSVPLSWAVLSFPIIQYSASHDDTPGDNTQDWFQSLVLAGSANWCFSLLLAVVAIMVLSFMSGALVHVTLCHLSGGKATMWGTRTMSSLAPCTLPTLLAAIAALVVWNVLCLALFFVFFMGEKFFMYLIPGHDDVGTRQGLGRTLRLGFLAVSVLGDLYIGARCLFSAFVRTAEGERSGFSAFFLRSGLLLKGYHLRLSTATVLMVAVKVPMNFMLQMITSHFLSWTDMAGHTWELISLIGLVVVLVVAALLFDAAVGVFFTVFYFSCRCSTTGDTELDYWELFGIIPSSDKDPAKCAKCECGKAVEYSDETSLPSSLPPDIPPNLPLSPPPSLRPS